MASEKWLVAGFLAAVGLGCAAFWVRNTTDRQMVEIMRSPRFNRGPLGMVFSAAIGSSIYFLMPFLLTGPFGASEGLAANVLLGLPVGIVATATFAGLLADRFGQPSVMLAGSVVSVISAGLLVGIDPSWSYGSVAAVLFLAGAAQAMIAGPVLSMTIGSAPPGGVGGAAAVCMLGRNVGFALGPALATIAWHTADDIATGFVVGLAAAILSLVNFTLIWHRARQPAPINAPAGS
jgi:MFS family permease